MTNWISSPPTEMGNYLWRKAEGGEAFASRVWAVDQEGLYITIGCTNYHVSEVGGEWLRLPSSDELKAMEEHIAATEEWFGDTCRTLERIIAARSELKRIREKNNG